MAVVFRGYLNVKIGFGSAANAIYVMNEGLDSIDTLSKYDKDNVASLCRVIRKGNANHMAIGPIVEKRLVYAANLAKHYTSYNRPLTATTLNRKCIKHFDEYIKTIDELKKQDNPELEKVNQKYSITK